MKTVKGFSLSEVAVGLLDKLARKMGVSRSAVVEIAVRYFVAHNLDFAEDKDSE